MWTNSTCFCKGNMNNLQMHRTLSPRLSSDCVTVLFITIKAFPKSQIHLTKFHIPMPSLTSPQVTPKETALADDTIKDIGHNI